jgi:hypothetical protein
MDGFGLVVGTVGHSNPQLVIILCSCCFAHPLVPRVAVFTIFLATASNGRLFLLPGSRKGGVRSISWFRYYATNRKVGGSIPDEVRWIFNIRNPSSCSMIMSLTWPLTVLSTRNLPGAKRGRRIRLIVSLPSVFRLC